MLQEGLSASPSSSSSSSSAAATASSTRGYNSGNESDGTSSTATLFEEDAADTDFDLDLYRCRAGSDPFPLRRALASVGGPITPISAATGTKAFDFRFQSRPLPALPMGEVVAVHMVRHPSPKM